MKKILIFIFTLFIITTSFAENLNIFSKQSVSFDIELLIHRAGREYIKKFNVFKDHKNKWFIEMFYPVEEMPKALHYNEDEIWVLENETFLKLNDSEANNKVFGSDITYFELEFFMSAKELDFTKEIISEDDNNIILAMNKKFGKKDIKKLIITYNKKLKAPLKIELFNKNNNLYKTVEYSDFKDVKGYNIPMKKLVTNELINNYYTIEKITNFKVNQTHKPLSIEKLFK